MKELSLVEWAYQDAHIAMKMGVVNKHRDICNRYALCKCGRRYCCDNGIDKCEKCRLSADIVETLDKEFDVEISLQEAEAIAKLYDRTNLEPFYNELRKRHPNAPLAYVVVSA